MRFTVTNDTPRAAGRRRIRRGVAAALIAVSSAWLWGCPSPSDPTPPPPQPPVPQRQLVTQGGFSGLRSILSFGEAFSIEFNTPSAGTLETSVDWTSSASDIDVEVFRAPCSLAQAVNDQCQSVGGTDSVSKPERFTITSLAAGRYVIYIYNVSSTTESGSYQIFLTS
jgi:hypothetical protein